MWGSSVVSLLRESVMTNLDAWNERCPPFAWTKDADAILGKASSGSRRASNGR